MVNMRDIFGDDWGYEFRAQSEYGNITLREHPANQDFLIANYTPKAAYDGCWTPVTLTSRGLIFNKRTGEVLARPFPKFFNYGQAGAPEIPLSQEVTAANKFDGSLGIAYYDPDGELAVATRGSFQSEQAYHATAVLRRAVPDLAWIKAELNRGWTPLFEIIYPQNRIVLDYGDADYLQYLGSVYNETGAFYPANPERLTFGELLARPPRPNAEGYVVWLNHYTAVKIKQDDYIALHAIVTNLSEKKVWEVVKQDSVVTWREFIEKLPDELQPWAEQIAGELQHAVYDDERYLYRVYDEVVEHAWEDEPRCADLGYIPRKVLALAVQQHVRAEDRWAMFAIADGKSIVPKLFDKHKPVGVGSRPTNAIANEEDA
jgi:RNA ligase